jgi:hypothetical protein
VQSARPEIGSEDRADGPQYAESDLRAVPMKEAGPLDKKASWTRIAITFAVDWRFVMAIVILVVLVLLMK